jgi:hypothetical protein
MLHSPGEQYDLRICNVNGIVVKAQKGITSGQDIDIATLSAGVYIVNVIDREGGQYQKKLVISE